MASEEWLNSDFAQFSEVELWQQAQKPGPSGRALLDGTRIRSLIEFNRCLHAEQAAIINAARAGVSTEGARLYTTTFPCHECAKYIVGAGIAEVYFNEPYPKSLVEVLYRDLINARPPTPTMTPAPSPAVMLARVPFRPFTGIAPRRYEVFFKGHNRVDGVDSGPRSAADAAPSGEGWSRDRVRETEAAVTTAVTEVLTMLADDPGNTGRSGHVEGLADGASTERDVGDSGSGAAAI
jgi:tRNA(Arg) A34 adenosine deaminase TadA